MHLVNITGKRNRYLSKQKEQVKNAQDVLSNLFEVVPVCIVHDVASFNSQALGDVFLKV